MKTSPAIVALLASLTAACNGSIYGPSRPPRLTSTRFLAFGDSITFGVSAACGVGSSTMSVRQSMALLAAEPAQPWSYPSTLQTQLHDRYVGQSTSVANRGIGGETLADGLKRLDTVLVEEQPDVMLLLEGANDLNQRVPPADIAASLASMIRTARARGVPTYVGTMLPQRPIGTAGSCRGFNPAGVAPTNDAIRTMAASEGAVLADLFQAFGGEPGALIGQDGLHPTEAGYQRIADVYYSEIRRRLED